MKKLRELKEELNIPMIGQTFSRDLMPQLNPAFLNYLKSQNIQYTSKTLNTNTLKSTQSEFDFHKVLNLMDKKDSDRIFVSNDDYVLDGHHRWLADHNTNEKTKAYVIDLPILELYRHAKQYESQLKEDVTHKDFGPMMDSFVSFASDKLGLLSIPKIQYKDNDDHDCQPSFGGYNPESHEIVISTKNRHPMDVFRTLAHELVHHKQNEDGRIKDVAKEGSTGSPIEDEANSMAGRLMRWFGKANPDKFALSHIVEEYTSTLSAYSPQSAGSKTIGREGGLNTSHPGPGQDRKNAKTWIAKTLDDYKPDDPSSYVTLAGNKSQFGKQVTIPNITHKTPEGKEVTYQNVRGYVHDTGRAFRKTGPERLDVAVGKNMTGELGDQPFSMKPHTLVRGWKTPNSDDTSKPTPKPQTPTTDDSIDTPGFAGGAAKSAGTTGGTTEPTPMKRSTSGAIARAARAASEMQEACWKGYYQPQKKKLKPKEGSPGQFVPNCVPKKQTNEELSHENDLGTPTLTQKYKEGTPGQTPGETFPKNPLFERIKKIIKKKLEEDGLLGSTLDMYNTPYTLPSSDTIGPEYGNRYSGITGFGAGIQSSLGTGYSYPFGTLAEGEVVPFKKKKQPAKKEELSNKPSSEPHPVNDKIFDEKNSVHQWVNARLTKPENETKKVTPQQAHENYKEFMERHGKDPDFGGEPVGIHEFMRHLKGYAGVNLQKDAKGGLFLNAGLHMPPKSIKQLKEAWEAIGKRDMGTVEKGTDEGRFDEDWQKINRQDKIDGLSQKAVNAYRRENPGSKLQTAVTEKNPKGKRAKRRLSFCRRMKGAKNKLTSAKTARDPDSRINKALRRWNCEE